VVDNAIIIHLGFQ